MDGWSGTDWAAVIGAASVAFTGISAGAVKVLKFVMELLLSEAQRTIEIKNREIDLVRAQRDDCDRRLRNALLEDT